MDEVGKIIKNPDPKAGLYVCKRNGSVVQVKIPEGKSWGIIHHNSLNTTMILDVAHTNNIIHVYDVDGLWTPFSLSFCSDHLGFQIGETSQILSGGVLKATPHAVRGPSSSSSSHGGGVASRSTLAVFMEPEVLLHHTTIAPSSHPHHTTKHPHHTRRWIRFSSLPVD